MIVSGHGLALVAREGRVRRARLNAAPMRTAVEWIQRYRRFWESELEATFATGAR